MNSKNYMLLLLALVVSFGLAAQDFFTETFADGIPTDWTTVEVAGNGTPSANWIWSETGPQGDFATAALASTSANDGWILFDSDLNCSLSTQDAWIISPAQNTIGKPTVWINFQTYYLSFNDRPQIRVGTDLDDLASWATYEVFPGIGANEFGGTIAGIGDANPQTILLNLSADAANQETVYVAFQFLSDGSTANGGNLTGCGYAWQIDDVILTETDPRPANDMRVNQNFFAISPNAITPASQVGPMGFIADIQNVGSADQDNVQLTISITNESGSEVFSDVLDYGTITSDSLAENVFFPNQFTPEPVPQIYTGRYTVTYDGSEEDSDPSNDFQEFLFSVSDTLFSKEIGATRSIAAADSPTMTYGNIFYLQSGENLDGSPVHARYMSFAVNNATDVAGKMVAILLLEWSGAVPGETGSESADEGEYDFIGFNSYEFTGSEGTNLITVPVSEDGAVELTEGNHYLVLVEFVADSEEDDPLFFLASEDFNYGAMNFYTDSLETIPEQYSAALFVGGGEEGSYSTLGFGRDIVPVTRLSIGGEIIVNTDETTLPKEAVITFPNPADAFANVNIGLAEATDARMTILNIEGRIMEQRQLGNVQSTRIQLDTQDLPSGEYLIRIDTKLGVANRRLTVQH